MKVWILLVVAAFAVCEKSPEEGMHEIYYIYFFFTILNLLSAKVTFSSV